MASDASGSWKWLSMGWREAANLDEILCLSSSEMASARAAARTM